MKNRLHINALLQQQQQARDASTKGTSKATSLQERIIAYSNYDFYLPDTSLYQLGKTDSASFVYLSGERGSKFNYNTMFYDAPTGVYDISYPVVNLFSGAHITYTGPYYQPAILCDSAHFWSAHAPDPTGRHLYVYAYTDSLYEVYDSSGNIILHYDQSNPYHIGNGNEYLNTYDDKNNNTYSVSLSWSSPNPALDTTNSMIHLYNISSKLYIDSLNNYVSGAWAPAEKWYYNYDVSGNLSHAMYFIDSSGVWVMQEQYFMTYNSDNTLSIDSDIIYKDGAWMLNNYNSYGYTEGISYYTSYESINFTDGVFDSKIVYTKHVSTSGATTGLPDTLFTSLYNVTTGIPPSYLASGTKSVFTYDGYKNPQVAYKYNYHITNPSSGAGYYDPSLDGVTYYYYQSYSGDGIKNVSALAENIIVYPNPVSNDLTISRPDAAKGTYTTMNLVNSLGQTVRTESMPWLNATETFSLAGVAPGMYVLLVQDSHGNTLSTNKIIKQ